jgi:site-specific DNA recombinase
MLNERGYRTRQSKAFTHATISRLLEDPTAKGLHRSNYTTGRDHANHTIRKDESEWVWNEVEPIVSEAMWEECARLLKARSQGKRPAKRATYLFSGIATCSCGAKMYVPAGRNKYVCTACHQKIPLDDLERLYRSAIAGFEYSPEDVAAHRQAANEAIRERDGLVAATETELKRLAGAEDELFELFHAGALTKPDFARRHRPISDRRAQLEDELPRLQADRDVLKIGLLSEEFVRSETNDLNGRWETMSFEQRRELVERITDKLVVGKEGIDIRIVESPFGNGDQKGTVPRTSDANGCSKGPQRRLSGLLWNVLFRPVLGPGLRG